jgi:hypothetical protein
MLATPKRKTTEKPRLVAGGKDKNKTRFKEKI